MAPPPVTTPAPITVRDLWSLHAEPGRLTAAARAWRAYAGKAREAARSVDEPAQRLYEGQWAGDTADTYDAHRRKLTDDIADGADLADRVAGALERAAGALTAAQSRLADSWARVTGQTPASRVGGDVTFRPPTPEHIAHVDAAVTEALQIRQQLDDVLLDDVVTMEKTRPGWRDAAAAWAATAAGTSDPFTLPPEIDGVSVIRDGNRVVLDTGAGNDTVEVTVDPATGEQVVTANGQVYRFPAGADIVVRAGDGQDTVTVAPGTRVNLTLLGGEGDDTIRGGEGRETVLGLDGRDDVRSGDGDDRVSGGADRDYLDGYRGNDALDGGLGDDTVYGLSGDDRVYGGEGRDYLEGATGNDTVDGGAGKDVVSGGRDDDRVRGGGDADAIYAGAGRDTVAGGSRADTAYAESGDTAEDAERVVTIEIKDLGGFIDIDGSPEFKERVQADLDMLRASPLGQKMLAELDDIHNDSKAIAADWPVLGGIAYQGNELTIKEDTSNTANYRRGVHLGETYEITYNPGRGESVDARPPVAGLFHEMAHVYDYGNNTSADGRYENPADPDQQWDSDEQRWVGVENDERQAVGLPIDHDDDDSTPYQVDPDHPLDYTENGFRGEMGWDPRRKYGQ
jgi:hypothetical protein